MTYKKQNPKSVQASKTNLNRNTINSDNTKHLQWIGICLLLTLIAFIPAFRAEFVNWDDTDYGYDNILIRSFDNFGKFFTTPVQGNYHPLTMISLAINAAISGNNATSYHVFNVLLHLANTGLAYWLAWRLSNGKFWVALVAGLLFGLHPMHVESVAWVSERKDLLYTFFFILGLLSYIRFVKMPSTNTYLAFSGLFILSLASKPAAVVFPLTLLVLDYWLNRPMKLKLIIEKIPHFALALLMGLLTVHAQRLKGATDISELAPFSKTIFFGCYSFMMYCVKLIFPVNLCTFYPFPPIKEALPTIYLISPIFLLAAVAVVFFFRKKSKLPIFTLAFFLVNIGLVLQFYVVGSAVMADRYTYLPYWSVFFLLGYGLDYLVNNTKRLSKTGAFMLVGSVALVLSAMSYQQATTWKNSATLWDNAIEACPSSKAYTNRAIIYRKQKDLKTALEYTNKALGINALDPEVLGARGNIYFDLQQYDKAIDDLSKSIEISPTNANFFNSRGAVYATVGKNELALADFNQAIKIDPFGPENYTNRALLYKSMNNNTAAIADYKTYLEKFNQNDFGIWNDIGACYYNNKEFNKAIESFNKAASLSPNNGQTFFNLSKVYLAMGDKANALSNAQIAQQKGEHIPPEYLQLIQ